MMYAIYDQYGKLIAQNLNEIITQGSNTTEVFVSVGNYEAEAGDSCVANFALPNGTVNTLVGLEESIDLGGTKKGWKFTLTAAQTYYAGMVFMSAKVKHGDDVLFTVPIILTVNKVAYDPDTQMINMAQYENIVTALNLKLDKAEKTRIYLHRVIASNYLGYNDIISLRADPYETIDDFINDSENILSFKRKYQTIQEMRIDIVSQFAVYIYGPSGTQYNFLSPYITITSDTVTELPYEYQPG